MRFFKDKILNFQIFSVIFTWIIGTTLHFVYKWSDKNKIVAVFAAVNESTWEHLKLLFFPMLITTIVGYFYFKSKDDVKNFLCAKMYGIVTSLSFVVIFFYTYTGIIGKNFVLLDIGSFFIGVFIGEYLAYKSIKKKIFCKSRIALIILSILFLCFVIFTYNAPHIGLFKDSITGRYGI